MIRSSPGQPHAHAPWLLQAMVHEANTVLRSSPGQPHAHAPWLLQANRHISRFRQTNRRSRRTTTICHIPTRATNTSSTQGQIEETLHTHRKKRTLEGVRHLLICPLLLLRALRGPLHFVEGPSAEKGQFFSVRDIPLIDLRLDFMCVSASLIPVFSVVTLPIGITRTVLEHNPV